MHTDVCARLCACVFRVSDSDAIAPGSVVPRARGKDNGKAITNHASCWGGIGSLVPTHINQNSRGANITEKHLDADRCSLEKSRNVQDKSGLSDDSV